MLQIQNVPHKDLAFRSRRSHDPGEQRRRAPRSSLGPQCLLLTLPCLWGWGGGHASACLRVTFQARHFQMCLAAGVGGWVTGSCPGFQTWILWERLDFWQHHLLGESCRALGRRKEVGFAAGVELLTSLKRPILVLFCAAAVFRCSESETTAVPCPSLHIQLALLAPPVLSAVLKDHLWCRALQDGFVAFACMNAVGGFWLTTTAVPRVGGCRSPSESIRLVFWSPSALSLKGQCAAFIPAGRQWLSNGYAFPSCTGTDKK